MTNNLAILLGVFCWAVPAFSQAMHSPEANPDQARTRAEMEIIDTVRARHRALAAGDCRTWMTYVDANFRLLEGDGTQDREAIVRGCELSRHLPDYSQKRSVSDFHFRWIGRTPIADYRYQTLEHVGEVTLSETIRQVCTFEKRQNSWIALFAVSIPLAHDPQAKSIDPKTLDEFAGVYGWVGAPQIADRIIRKGNQLFVRGTADPGPTELIPIGDDAFFIHGSFGDHLTFVRDTAGKVVGEEVRSPDGQGYRATKSKTELSENEFNQCKEN